jgi:phosphoribosyl 1,2-cyclic phosphodiesterase
MKLWVLGSGSRGNAVVVESNGTRLMIDVGFGPRILQKRLAAAGIEPESIEACIITHEHSDHIRGAARAARRWQWPLFCTDGTYNGSRLAALETPAARIAPGATISFSEMDVTTFRTPHDAEESIGVVVTARSSGVRAAIATDLGIATQTVRDAMMDVDMMVVESNHDEDMLANGPYPLMLQRRVAGRNGHLSNSQCASLVRDVVSTRLRKVILAHLSEENNAPNVAFDTMRPVLKRTRFKGTLAWAPQDSVVGPFEASLAGRAESQLNLGL